MAISGPGHTTEETGSTNRATIAQSEVERVFRAVAGQAVATLVRRFGDIGVAEDAVQDAFVAASRRWPTDGIPANPAGWIVTTARNRAIDQLRRAKRGRELLHQAAAARGIDDRIEPGPDPASLSERAPSGPDAGEGGDVDDRLRLIFTCCHPSLRPEHQIALTLRLLGGLSVDEIAAAFVVNDATMAKRLVRAKYKIKAANIPYRVPEPSELPVRLRSALSVLYLIYNAGTNDLDAQQSLRADAIRLARALATLLPDEPEAAGLLALLLLNESRVAARRDGEDVVVLRDQDRTTWDRALIEEGQAIVRACIRTNRPGPFQVQAAIQAVHCDAADYEDTDWHQIVTLYDHLVAITPTPVIGLNRAIAVAETEGPEVALRLLDDIADDLEGYCPLHAARATMLRRLDCPVEATVAFERAAETAPSDAERRYFLRQVDRVSAVIDR